MPARDQKFRGSDELERLSSGVSGVSLRIFYGTYSGVEGSYCEIDGLDVGQINGQATWFALVSRKVLARMRQALFLGADSPPPYELFLPHSKAIAVTGNQHCVIAYVSWRDCTCSNREWIVEGNRLFGHESVKELIFWAAQFEVLTSALSALGSPHFH